MGMAKLPCAFRVITAEKFGLEFSMYHAKVLKIIIALHT